ncbi:hypothetical protein EDF31_102550 [Curtobacterium sp. PhB142]|uniref:hypothetical protein n=1 Tax=unclassified Curtobacterium TaxID=257496 RepID=UPI001049774A|nr:MULTISPECIES: hypothetical protein [unclassified Curtobacterium]TCL87841.1 hypothetical protein EDF31_102550 [Curtobacterium sp. PhB142]TCM04810.1 hypothetical protein EDF26_10129 [Curtobacterium sp. PhB134]
MLKFLARADWVLKGPIFEARAMDAQGWAMGFRVQPIPGTDRVQIVGLDLGVPDLDDDVLQANAARCRVFFAMKEDSYLPTVVSLLRQSVGADRRAALDGLKRFVNARVKNGDLVGAHMYSGRVLGDNGENAGQMHGNDQIAMDYIYGRLLHETPDALKRLDDVTTDATVRHAVVSKLHDLMQAVYWTRAELLRAAVASDLDFELPEEVRKGRDSFGGVLPQP